MTAPAPFAPYNGDMTSRPKRRFKEPTGDEPEAAILAESGPAPREGTAEVEGQAAAGKLAVTRARLDLAPTGEPALYGTKAFFRMAAEQLSLSTRFGLELAGACYARRTKGGKTVLVGLKRGGSGLPGRVAISPQWGSILWHTHPGLRLSLAAFSAPDLEAARRSKRPLLVIGFGGLSPDVLSTLTLPLGKKGLLLSGGLKGLLALEKSGKLKERLLRLGVAARVCYPDGTIQPVLRYRATPLTHALDDMSFAIDRSVGAIERAGQNVLSSVIGRLTRGD
jgi:hypothetical protein